MSRGVWIIAVVLLLAGCVPAMSEAQACHVFASVCGGSR